jgi:hypothetical protein
MSELKNEKNDGDVARFISGVDNAIRRVDSEVLLEIMREATAEPGSMWVDSMIGFGSYDYKYVSGRSGTWFAVGFSPRKQNTVVYIMPGFERYDDLRAKLGKHKTGKSCLYINKLENVDLDILSQLVSETCKLMTESR